MNLLVTLNSNYIFPLCVMLSSLSQSNPNTHFDIFVAYSSLTEDDFSLMEKALGESDFVIHKRFIEDSLFSSAPVLDRISKETYYRLLIDKILPEDTDRVLYIDPDVVIKGDLSEFYERDMTSCTVVGCTHLYNSVQNFNLNRLKMKKTSCYINAGILLIDVRKWKEKISGEEIIRFVSENYKRLHLADQDVLNILFEDETEAADERKYNLDEKTYKHFSKIKGEKRIDMKWVEENTVIVHFNGKHKPWGKKKYRGCLGEYFEKYRNF